MALIDDITKVEQDIKAVHERAQMAWRRVMRETESGSHNSALALMELCVGGLSRAESMARYARHELGATNDN